jgi:hypothetical protein
VFYRAATVRRMQREHREELRARDDQIERLLDKLMALSGVPAAPVPYYPPLPELEETPMYEGELTD